MSFWHSRIPWYVSGGIALAIFAAFFAWLHVSRVDAAQTIPYKINFQGRLTTAGGAPYADGLYNMRLRLYNVATGGTNVWTETRETTNRVQLTGGLFSIQLGDVTALSPTLFTTQDVYLEVEMPTPGTATCSTASCASFTEGAMTPRSKLGATAYSFNADTIDGIDGASLAQLGTANTFTNTNAFSGANSATKFQVIDNSSVALLVVDTSATVVKIGNPGASSLAGVRLMSTSAEFSGTVRIGSVSNGVDISGTGVVLSGTAQPTNTISFSPEYAGVSLTGDGTNNTGALTSDFCSGSSRLNVNASLCGSATSERSYYQWSNTQSTVQDYDMYVRYRLPADYATGSLANLVVEAWGTTSSTEKIDVSLYSPATNTACSTLNAVSANATWQANTSASPLGACTPTAGDTITLKVHVEAAQNNFARVGQISLQYKARY